MKKPMKRASGGVLDRDRMGMTPPAPKAPPKPKPAPKAPSSVLDRDRMGMTPPAPSKPKSAHQEWRESAGAKSSDRKSPITAPIVKTGTVTKPNPMKRTALTPTQKAKIDKAADDLVKSAKPAAKPALAKPAAKPAAKSSPKLSSFGAAFKAARDKAKKAGDADGGVFTWNGKQYTTKQK